ncbi:MAG: hypothetical protein ACI4L8_06535 [Candidatus Fimadaptatus sp.]
MKRIFILALSLLLALCACAAAEPAAPEALDMTVLSESSAYQFDFLPWFSAPEAAHEAFAGVEWRRVNIDGELTLIEFGYPSALTGGEGRMRLIYRLTGGDIALTEIRFTEMLPDAGAAAAYIDALASRYEDMQARQALGRSSRTLLKVRESLDEENLNDGAYHLRMTLSNVKTFAAPDGAEYGAQLYVQVDPVKELGEYLPGEGEYFAAISITLASGSSGAQAAYYMY